MKKLFLILILLTSFSALSSDYYGCDTVAIDHAAIVASQDSNLSRDQAKELAGVEVLSFNETYGSGEFSILIGDEEYYVEIVLWDDYSCSVKE